MQVVVKRATRLHVDQVAANLREEDYKEVRLVHPGGGVFDVVVQSGRISKTDAVLLDGEVVALAGCSRADDSSLQVGLVWMLCTPGVSRGPRRILKAAKGWLEEQHRTYPVLANRAWSGNALHLGWLRLLGFTLMPPVLVNGAEFIPFYRSKEDPFHV